MFKMSSSDVLGSSMDWEVKKQDKAADDRDSRVLV